MSRDILCYASAFIMSYKIVVAWRDVLQKTHFLDKVSDCFAVFSRKHKWLGSL